MPWSPYFTGDGTPKDVTLPAPPPWRTVGEQTVARGARYQSSDIEVELVNTAIMLRRPLLITGHPGTGKSTLTHAVAYELKLGPALVWPITSKTTLNDGLYRYDAIGRLQEAGLYQRQPDAEPPKIERYLRLGPLGTALASATPRVLLVDELDKSDIDLPNDLLHVFEEGRFNIPELERLSTMQPEVAVRPADDGEPIHVRDGQVHCESFPVVFFTSNGERDFPPAFLRRCLRLDLRELTQVKLRRIVEAHLGPEVLDVATPLIDEFLSRIRSNELLATDQLLNAIYLVSSAQAPENEAWDRVKDAVLRVLANE